MADYSRPLHRNHVSSAIFSNKLSKVHSFTGKSIYDDVFDNQLELGAPTFPYRVKDYSEIFKTGHSSPSSSVPFLNLPNVDKPDVSVDFRNSKLDYTKIFGGFDDIDFDVPYEELTKSKAVDSSSEGAWTPDETGSPPKESGLSSCPENDQATLHEATCQSIGGKKQFKMSYHRTNSGSKDGENGTTHITQLHAVPGFTCMIDETTPLPRKEGNKPLPSNNEVSPTPDISKGIMEGKHSRKPSSQLSERGVDGHASEDGASKCGRNGSFSNDILPDAYESGLESHHHKVIPPSGPIPNLGNNNNNASNGGMASKSWSYKSDDFESAAGDLSPTFSDEEVDKNSAAAASAAAVRKAIEKAQASIRMAKELMERKKGFQSSMKQSFKAGLKIKETRENKIANEAKTFKIEKAQEIGETETASILNFAGTEMQNERTNLETPSSRDWIEHSPAKGPEGDTNGKVSESDPVLHKEEGQKDLGAAIYTNHFVTNEAETYEVEKAWEIGEREKASIQIFSGTERQNEKTNLETPDSRDSIEHFPAKGAEEETNVKVSESDPVSHKEEGQKDLGTAKYTYYLIAKETKTLEVEKAWEVGEREKASLQNFSGTERQNERTNLETPNSRDWIEHFPAKGAEEETNGKVSESEPVSHKKEGQKDLGTAKDTYHLVAKEAKTLEVEKAWEVGESEKASLQNFAEKERQNERTNLETPNSRDWIEHFPAKGAEEETNGKVSESDPVSHKEEGKKGLAAAIYTYFFVEADKYGETSTTVFEQEDIKEEMMQPVDKEQEDIKEEMMQPVDKEQEDIKEEMIQPVDKEQEDIKEEMMQPVDKYERKRWKATVNPFKLPASDGENLKVVEEAIELEQIRQKLNAVGGEEERESQSVETNGKSDIVLHKEGEQKELGAAKNSYDFVHADRYREMPTMVFEQENTKEEMMQHVDKYERKRWKATVNPFDLAPSDGKKLEMFEEAFELEQFRRKLNAVGGAEEWGDHAVETIGKTSESNPGFEQDDNKRDIMQSIDKYGRKRWKATVNPFKLPASDGRKLEEVEEAFELEQFRRKLNAEGGAEEWENCPNKLGSAKDIPECEDNEEKLRVSQKQAETKGKLTAFAQQGRDEDKLFNFEEPVENQNGVVETQKREADTCKIGLRDFQKQLEKDMILKQAHKSEENEKRSEEGCKREEKGKKIRELLEQEEYEMRCEESAECGQIEKKPSEPCDWEERRKLIDDTHSGQDYESRLEKVDKQEQRLDDQYGGKAIEKSLKEDIDGDVYEKLNEASKQEENDNLLKEAKWKEENEEEKEAYQWEERGSKQRQTCWREESEKKIKATQESLTCEERSYRETCFVCEQGEIEDLSGVEVNSRHKDNENNLEASEEESANQNSWRMAGATKATSEPAENDGESKADEVKIKLVDQEMLRRACWNRDTLDGADKAENGIDDEPQALLINDNGVNEPEENEEMFETANLARDALIQNDSRNKVKDATAQNKEESRFACSLGDDLDTDVNIAEVSFDQVEEINQFKVAHGDKECTKSKEKEEVSELNRVYQGKEETLRAAQDIKTSQNTEHMKENGKTTLATEATETKETMQKDVMLEKEHLKNIDEAKEKERERERERLAVERAIREARERAFAEARDKASTEKATAEARQRVKAAAGERSDKAFATAKSLAEKVTMEAKVKAERAAVERATAEARERALKKALSEKSAFEARELAERSDTSKFSGPSRNNGTSRSFPSSDQYQGSSQSRSLKHSDSTNNGVHNDAEKFDDGARGESSHWSKARLEKHQRIAERAAKVLEEKNMRDLLAQKDQAERNRLAEALDADVRRWSSGKTGNLRALLSTLQYILGPDSGWQPIPLTDIVTTNAVKKAYRKATLFVHPDKLQQRGASVQQKYKCEKVFDLLKDAWNKFNPEER